MMKTLFLILLFFAAYLSAYAQTEEKNTYWMEYLEEMAENEIESAMIENLYEELSYLAEHPFDLNTVSKKELERLPFLSDIQIENILYYVYKYSPLVNIYELKNIEGLDYQTIRFLLPFVYVGDLKKQESINLKEIVKYGKNEILLRMDDCFQKKSGYQKVTEEEKEKNPNRYYLGEPYYLSFRYGFSYKDQIQFGFAGEKDSGEPFWNSKHKGFGFYSIHLALKNWGILDGLYLGDYRLSFGQGLVLNTDFILGKTSDVANLGKKNSGIKRHFSTNENDFFRGGAVALKFNQMKMHLFLSHRSLDANADSATIYTFKTDGYNRTVNDLKKQRQASINLMGANIQWRNDFFNIGLTGAAYNFGNKKLDPEMKEYNLYYLRGKKNFNIGMDYAYQRKKLLFQGETAVSENGGIATINNLLISPGSGMNFSLSYRNYSCDYQAFYSRSLSESSSTQNESGFYFGMKLSFLKRWILSGYIDCFRFPWLKYGIDAPSMGKDALLQITYKASEHLNLSLRYKHKEKEKNVSEKGATTILLPYDLHRWKFQLNYQLKPEIALKMQADYNLYVGTDERQTRGWSVSELITYKSKKKKIQLDLALAYFNAVGWDNRISNYERNVLYAFSMATFYGEGIRYYSVFNWSIFNRLTFYVKVASSHYFDKNRIGSGLEEIAGRKKTDLNCLLKFKF